VDVDVDVVGYRLDVIVDASGGRSQHESQSTAADGPQLGRCDDSYNTRPFVAANGHIR
jgi:hypothetical protein